MIGSGAGTLGSLTPLRALPRPTQTPSDRTEAQGRPRMQRQDFDALAERLRNWGRWGAEDQRGTLNHIGPETLKDAAATVTSGKLFTLGLNFDKNGPQLGAGRFNPKLYVT